MNRDDNIIGLFRRVSVRRFFLSFVFTILLRSFHVQRILHNRDCANNIKGCARESEMHQFFNGKRWNGVVESPFVVDVSSNNDAHIYSHSINSHSLEVNKHISILHTNCSQCRPFRRCSRHQTSFNCDRRQSECDRWKFLRAIKNQSRVISWLYEMIRTKYPGELYVAIQWQFATVPFVNYCSRWETWMLIGQAKGTQ